MTTRAPITIIGAGLAGLTLGRRLQKLNIPAVIYEKTPTYSSSSSRHAYALALHHNTWHDVLLDLLDTNDVAFKERLCVDYKNSSHWNDETISDIGNKQKNYLQLIRARLEEWLREGLDIKYDTEIKDITILNTSSSRPHKAVMLNDNLILDKNSPLTISADGVHSKLRNFLSQSTEMQVLPFVVFYGRRRRVPLDDYDRLYKPELKGGRPVIIFKKGEGAYERLQILANVHYDDGVEISYTYSRPARAAEKDGKDGTPGRPNLFMPHRSPGSAKDVPEGLFTELAEFRKSVCKPPCREEHAQLVNHLLDDQELRKDRILNWLMRSHLTPLHERKEWLSQYRVMLLGDAVQSSPIIGGQGADYAIMAANKLGKYIADEGSLETWEENMDREYRRRKEQAEKIIADIHSYEHSVTTSYTGNL